MDAGAWHPPSLTGNAAQTQVASRSVFPASTIRALRMLMRTAVRSGAASQAGQLSGGPVYGQVGTAQVAKRQWANWFVGYRGGVAFAVLVLSQSPQTSAVPAGTRFLSLLP